MNGKYMDKESDMAEIYERNPDTDEVRTRRRIEPVKEPIYRNEAAETIEILNRMEKKIDALIERMENK